ncbi:MAG: hypothetical protein IPK71_15145 [Myxococcales bacterium]|jgi:hypothetical protein|nr:hypothetical protein [Myxococcales bacterium]
MAAHASIVMFDEHGTSSTSTASDRVIRVTFVLEDEGGGSDPTSVERPATPVTVTRNSALLEDSRVKLEPFEEGLVGGRISEEGSEPKTYPTASGDAPS